MKKLSFFLTIIFLACFSLSAQITAQGGYAVSFDGSNDYVYIGTPTAMTQLATGSYTIEAWIKTSTTARQCIVGNYNYNSSPDPRTQAWVLELHSSGNLRMYVNGTACNSDPIYTVSDGKWHHVAGVRNNATSSVYMYVDGKLIYSNVGGVPGTGFTVSNYTQIGSNPCTGGYALPFNGNIDEVRMWNTARTEAQIKANMYKELVGNESGLVGYYKLNNGTGATATDNSPNANHGTLTNGPLWELSGCLGGSRQALDFDGSNDNVTFPYNAALVITASVTIEAWVNLATTGQQCYVAGKITHGNPQYGYGMYINSGNLGGDPGQITFIAGRSWFDWPSVRSNARLETNKWYHVVGTFDGRYLKIYVNGKLDNTYDRGSTYTMNDSGDNFKIGYNGNLGTNYFSGKIDEVRVWNTARTETQIRENFLKTLAGNEAGLVAYYRMDQTDGTTLYDMTANGINGTLNNMDAATDWVSSGAFNTWIGAENDLWSNADNWTNGVAATGQSLGFYNTSNGKDFTINSAVTYNSIYLSNVNSLTLNTATQLTLTGNFFNDAELSIKSDISGDASFIVKGAVDGSGTYNVERYLTANTWHFVTSPITTGTAGVFQGIWLRPYVESTNTFGEYIVPTETPMPTGQGFSVWAPTAQTRTFTGTINSGSQGSFAASLTGSAGANTGWNLMGNPFTSAIDWDAASGWTKTNLANSVYIWNGTQYATYVAGVGANGGSRFIPKGQGFFVQANASGASLSMNSNVQVHNSATFMKSDFDPANTIRINVSSQGFNDEAVVVIRESDNYAFDPETDAYKFFGSAEAPQIYTSKSDLGELSIASFSTIYDIIGLPVTILPAQSGVHTISWSHNCQEDTPVLYDNLTNTYVLPSTDYAFTASDMDPFDRFVFKLNATEVDQALSDVNIWCFDNILYLQNNTNHPVVRITIFNSLGQVLMVLNQENTNLNMLCPGIYSVKVELESKTVVEKILIR
jgi:hypothetical protein